MFLLPPPPPDTVIVAPPPPPEQYSARTLIIFYDREQGKDSLMQAVEDYRAETIYQYRIIAAIAIKIPEDADIEEAKKHFQQVKGVLMVERDRVMHLHEMQPDRVKKD